MKSACIATLLLGGCVNHAIPDPEPVARGFARACAQGDMQAVRGFLGADQNRALGDDALRARLAERGNPARCRALATSPVTVDGTATMQFATGETATVVTERGEPRIAAAGALPGGAGTPAGALASFRGALVRWLAGSALGPFTTSTRTRTDERLRALARGLEKPESLLVDVAGDRANVDVEPGHFVSLRREGGLWKVEAFE